MDFNIRLSSGHVLRGFIKSPGENLKGVVILVHGLGEHIQRYLYWSDQFNNSGFGFSGVDLPGHGLSDGRRGHIKSYSLTDEMIDILLNECRKTFPGTPLFLYGHSLGGGIVLDYLVRKSPEITGAIVTSPWIKLSFEPDKVKVLIASVMKIVLPGLQQPSGLVHEHLSRDSEVVEKYKRDPLIHYKISVSLFSNAMSAAENALKNSSMLKIPLLIIHGSDDMICSPEGSKEFCSNTNQAELKIWEGGYHELHNEPFRDEVFACIKDWMNRIPGK